MLGLTTTVTTGKLPGCVFDEFYGKHYQSVYRAAKRVTRNFHDAQDIVQTVFARLLEQGRLSRDFLKNPEAYLCQDGEKSGAGPDAVRRKFSTDPLERLIVSAPEMEDPWMFDALTKAMEELSSRDECSHLKINAFISESTSYLDFQVFGGESGPAVFSSSPIRMPDKPLTVGGECNQRNVSASVRRITRGYVPQRMCFMSNSAKQTRSKRS